MRDSDVEAVNDLSIKAFEDLTRAPRRAALPAALATGRVRAPPPPARDRSRRLLGRRRRERRARPAPRWRSCARGSGASRSWSSIPASSPAGWAARCSTARSRYGDGARGGIILASPDPRALRAYARAGLHAAARRSPAGTPRGVAPAPRGAPVHRGRPCRWPRASTARCAARRTAPTSTRSRASGCELLAFPDRGYAVRRDGDAEAARGGRRGGGRRRCCARCSPERPRARRRRRRVAHAGARQWGIDVVLAARARAAAEGRAVPARRRPARSGRIFPAGPTCEASSRH